jgi:hypothetical protein
VYDVIGDVHGHADELEALLARLGYRVTRGAHRHPERTAVFVGDFLDRGPKIRETLRIVRPMLEEGSALAVLGNHEWNAFAWHAEDPDVPGAHLRRHDPKNLKQHEATLAQVPAPELSSHLAFLKTLPVRLELDGANVVHACWDEVAFPVLDEALARHGGITDAFLVEGSDQESLLYDALEIALKGKEMTLPPGESFQDKDGVDRDKARVRWYTPPDGHTVASYSLPRFAGLSEAPLPAKVIAEARPYPTDRRPVFFGHYWLDDPKPAPLAPNVVCLDYSVARGGFLCGFRLDQEERIDSHRFATVPARAPQSGAGMDSTKSLRTGRALPGSAPFPGSPLRTQGDSG